MHPVTNAIIGAGPVGLSLALMRSQSGHAVTLVDKAEATVAAQDGRSLAISYGSIQLLRRIGLDIQQIPHTPIQHIHISEQGAWGHTQLHHDELSTPMLGAVVRYGALVEQLTCKLESQSNIHIIRPAIVTNLVEHDHHVALSLNTEQSLTSDLVVHAEGGLFNTDNTTNAQHDYQQTALIANVALKRAKVGWAWERFTSEGPCALLPASADGLTFNLVWCMSRTRAEQVNALSDAAFITELNQTVAHLTGQIDKVTPRIVFPLGLRCAPDLHSRTRVAIGNAAQTLHPVAGQGFNLGLRDAFILNQSLNEQPSVAQALSAFNHHRQFDRTTTVRITDTLARGFFSEFGIKHLRSVGFGLINALPPLKKRVAEQFMFGVR